MVDAFVAAISKWYYILEKQMPLIWSIVPCLLSLARPPPLGHVHSPQLPSESSPNLPSPKLGCKTQELTPSLLSSPFLPLVGWVFWATRWPIVHPSALQVRLAVKFSALGVKLCLFLQNYVNQKKSFHQQPKFSLNINSQAQRELLCLLWQCKVSRRS